MPRGKHRDKLLDQGLRLLSERGFGATGVAEVTEAGGVPKGSFYNYFPSKEDFAIEVLSRYQDQACTQMSAVLCNPELAPLERLRRLFESLIEKLAASGFTAGCLAGRLAQEVAGENPTFRKPLEDAFASMRNLVAVCLEQARQAGEIPAEESPERLAEFLLFSWQGAMLRAKAAGNDGPLQAFLDIAFNRLLKPSQPVI
ncbi:MAG: TetR family transcriptional regulator C-terminal domain-containing protein [Thermoanaerobaculia bacterium]